MADSIWHLMPGLGVDGRVFQKLTLPFQVKVLNWLPPEKSESWQDYVIRMNGLIEGDQPVLVGVSQGGMLVQDLTRLRNVRAVVLISTLTHQDSFPQLFKWARFFPFYRLIQGSWRIKTLRWWAPRVGIIDPQEQQLLADMFSQQNDRDRMWAMQQVLRWQGPELMVPHLRIHGTKDRVFPAYHIHDPHVRWVQGGNHFMVYQQATSIRQMILSWWTT